MRKLLRSCPVVTALVGLPILGCAAGSSAPAPAGAPSAAAEAPRDLPEGVTPQMIESGREIFAFEGNCVSCHGDNGEGGSLGPNLTDDQWIHIDGSYQAIIGLINTGVPEPEQYTMEMAPEGGTDLTDEQVAAVAAYVWSLSRG